MKFVKSEDQKKITFSNGDTEITCRKKLGFFEKNELKAIKLGGLDIVSEGKGVRPKFVNPSEVIAQVETDKALLKRLVCGWNKENFNFENLIEFLGDPDNEEFTAEIVEYLKEQNGFKQKEEDEEKKQDTQS